MLKGAMRESNKEINFTSRLQLHLFLVNYIERY